MPSQAGPPPYSQAGINGRPQSQGPLLQQPTSNNGTAQQHPQMRSFSDGAVGAGPNQATGGAAYTMANNNQQPQAAPMNRPFSQVDNSGMQQAVIPQPGSAPANGAGFQSNAANAGAGRGRPPPNGYPGNQGPGQQQISRPQAGPANGYISSGPQASNMNSGAGRGLPPSNSY